MVRRPIIESERLLDLQQRKELLTREIMREKTNLQKRSQRHATNRLNALGVALERLHEKGHLNEDFMVEIKESLLVVAEGKTTLFEALRGTAFDLMDLEQEYLAAVAHGVTVGKMPEQMQSVDTTGMLAALDCDDDPGFEDGPMDDVATGRDDEEPGPPIAAEPPVPAGIERADPASAEAMARPDREQAKLVELGAAAKMGDVTGMTDAFLAYLAKTTDQEDA